MTNAVVELRRAANSIFTAADQPVAGEISAALVQAANEIERLRNIITGCPVCSELERNIKPADEPSEGPASLVGALQDVVHTDTGPVRAGHSVKSVSAHLPNQAQWCQDPDCPQCASQRTTE